MTDFAKAAGVSAFFLIMAGAGQAQNVLVVSSTLTGTAKLSGTVMQGASLSRTLAGGPAPSGTVMAGAAVAAGQPAKADPDCRAKRTSRVNSDAGFGAAFGLGIGLVSAKGHNETTPMVIGGLIGACVGWIVGDLITPACDKPAPTK